jgi:hypothetical protein
MSTITGTSDQRQWTNVTSFRVGDTIRGADGRIGTIVTPPGMISTQVSPGPPPVNVLLPQPPAPVPLSTPADPITLKVDVHWMDGTASVVLLSTLRRV